MNSLELPLYFFLLVSKKGCTLIMFEARRLDRLRMRTPQLNYYLRKLRSKELSNQAP